jgi:hypothetical protein
VEPSVALGELPPDEEESLFMQAGVSAADLPEVMRVYRSVLAELEWHVGIIVAATPEQRVVLLNHGLDLGEWVRFAAFWKNRRTRICPPDPTILREAARRVVGIRPSIPAPAETDCATFSILYAVAGVAHIRREDRTN